MQDEELKTILLGRMGIYEYLYFAYYKAPKLSFLDNTEKFAEAINGFTAINNDLSEGSRLLQDWLESISGLPAENTVQKLNAAFTKLFIMPNGVNSKESDQRSKEVNKNDIILDLIEYFAKDNIAKPTVINLPLESYSIELFYMFKTSAKIIDAKKDAELASLLESQKSFLENHLLCWSDDFLAETIKKCEEYGRHTIFYKALSYICRGFLNYDHGLLKSISNMP